MLVDEALERSLVVSLATRRVSLPLVGVGDEELRRVGRAPAHQQGMEDAHGGVPMLKQTDEAEPPPDDACGALGVL